MNSSESPNVDVVYDENVVGKISLSTIKVFSFLHQITRKIIWASPLLTKKMWIMVGSLHQMVGVWRMCLKQDLEEMLHPGALYLRAVYMTWNCVKQDTAFDLRCFLKASEKGHAGAAIASGLLLLKGAS